MPHHLEENQMYLYNSITAAIEVIYGKFTETRKNNFIYEIGSKIPIYYPAAKNIEFTFSLAKPSMLIDYIHDYFIIFKQKDKHIWYCIENFDYTVDGAKDNTLIIGYLYDKNTTAPLTPEEINIRDILE